METENTGIFLTFAGSVISFDTLLLWIDVFTGFMGITVFLSVIQLMEVLCLNEHISVLNSTLRVSQTQYYTHISVLNSELNIALMCLSY